ncbi:MAG: helicase C-terminal domain-containing protein [Candidatus Gracilibacteria bacterium]|nr:helicase C-terminal domain-containing protein [Candidatus Gracilibacteria bacterium]
MIIALDLETTGLDNTIDKIIEIGLVKFDKKTFEIIEQKSFLVNPEIEIPELITNITNISNKDVKDSPLWKDLIFEIEDFIGDYPILGHNTKFDSGFLRFNGIELINNLELDTFEYANFLLKDEKSLSLEYLANSLKFGLEGAHRALNDTLATVKLFKILVDKIEKMSSRQRMFFEYIASVSEINNLNFVYSDILGLEKSNTDPQIFLKELLKSFPENRKNIRRNIDSEIKISGIEDFIKNNPELELRENQALMSNYIKETFDKEEKIVIEAPTGVGKTFAYLLPSIINSVKTGEQVYISTSTKALQDQIFYKDLSFLEKNLDIEFSYCKLKGKSNYISVASFINFISEKSTLNRLDASFVLKILFWLLETKSGELDELDYYGKEYGLLNEINANNFYTFSKENIYTKYEFSINARKNAKKANIVIINNNILFQDIHGDNSILGKVENLILDEAHTLEDVVTNSLKKGFNLRDFEKNIINLEKILKKYKFEIGGLQKKTDNLIFEMGIIFDTFQLYLNKNLRNNEKYQNLLIKDDFYDDNMDAVDKKELSNIFLLKITEYIDQFSILPDKVYLAITRELNFLEDVIKTIKILLDKQDKNKYIKLVSYNERLGGIILEYTRLNVGEYLNDKLWSKLNTIILTSATLKIGENFDYITKILSLKDLFLVARGNILVLFTAFYAIRETYTKLGSVCKKEKMNIYAQGVGGGKHKLIEAFKKNADNSVLIGTDTFWEGIDIPGSDLKYLVIHKVPFMVPTDPIFQARSALFQNAFMEYGVPKSILKLKQGFGRLIRTKEDTGIIIFLDDRIYSTSWGKVFYDAFPDNIKIRKGKSEELIHILQKKKG